MGTISKNDSVLAIRLSDSDEAGCPFYDVDRDPRVRVGNIPNHYETQIALPPGDYDLQAVVSYKAISGESKFSKRPVEMHQHR
jgi:hypothetical protein